MKKVHKVDRRTIVVDNIGGVRPNYNLSTVTNKRCLRDFCPDKRISFEIPVYFC